MFAQHKSGAYFQYYGADMGHVPLNYLFLLSLLAILTQHTLLLFLQNKLSHMYEHLIPINDTSSPFVPSQMSDQILYHLHTANVETSVNSPHLQLESQFLLFVLQLENQLVESHIVQF